MKLYCQWFSISVNTSIQFQTSHLLLELGHYIPINVDLKLLSIMVNQGQNAKFYLLSVSAVFVICVIFTSEGKAVLSLFQILYWWEIYRLVVMTKSN